MRARTCHVRTCVAVEQPTLPEHLHRLQPSQSGHRDRTMRQLPAPSCQREKRRRAQPYRVYRWRCSPTSDGRLKIIESSISFRIIFRTSNPPPKMNNGSYRSRYISLAHQPRSCCDNLFIVQTASAVRRVTPYTQIPGKRARKTNDTKSPNTCFFHLNNCGCNKGKVGRIAQSFAFTAQHLDQCRLVPAASHRRLTPMGTTVRVMVRCFFFLSFSSHSP